MVLILIGVIFIGACHKWGDWRNWELYYSTIIFYILAVFLCEVLMEDKPLWLIKGSFWQDFTANCFLAGVIFPCIIIMFLTNYPKNIIKQICYILSIVMGLSLIEYVTYIRKGIFFYNGWNIGWSILLYMGMLPLLRIHFKKPLLAWLILVVLVISGIFYFKINISGLR